MIAYLIGQPKLTTDNKLILLANGVGYGILASSRVIAQVQNKQQVSLYIYTYVKEDKLELYGFLNQQDQQLFELVLGVSGIGPATALSMMDKDAPQLIHAVQEADVAFFKAIPRIGKKMAQKIIIELRGKLGELKELNLKPLSNTQQQVADALMALGWDEDSIRPTLEQLDLESLSESEAIKQALRLLKP